MLTFLEVLKRRKRTILALASFAVILLAGGGIVYRSTRLSLSDFVDEDLRKLDDDNRPALNKMLGRLFPEQFPGPRTQLNKLLDGILPWQNRLEPWYIWRLESETGSSFILFEAQ